MTASNVSPPIGPAARRALAICRREIEVISLITTVLSVLVANKDVTVEYGYAFHDTVVANKILKYLFCGLKINEDFI